MSDTGEPPSSGSSEHSGQSDDSYEQWELAALALLPKLPRHIQDTVFEFCDLPTLAALCRLDKYFNQRITPLLWRHLEFPRAFEEENLTDATRKFFFRCATIMKKSPELFDKLAANVQTLDVGRLYGINVVEKDDKGYGHFAYYDFPHEGPTVFDVIARFTNLTTLAMYVKDWWGGPNVKQNNLDEIARNSTKFTELALGGQMPGEVLQALFSKPDRLKSLTLVNLMSTPGQSSGPFLTACISDPDRFKSLETLYLCKLADLDGRRWAEDDDENFVEGYDDYFSDEDERQYVSGMRWKFPRQSEVALLEDWAGLLQHTSATLREVKLENCFLCSYGFEVGNDDSVIDPGNTHLEEYGAVSIQACQRILFPKFSGHEWPRLEKLTLVGMGKSEDIKRTVSHLEPRVLIEHRPAGFVDMGGDATPEQVATPVEFSH